MKVLTYKTFARKLIKYNHFVDFNDTDCLTYQLLGVLPAHALLPVLGLPPLPDLVLQLLAVLLLEASVRRVPVMSSQLTTDKSESVQDLMLLLIVFLTLSFAWNLISGFPKIAVLILPDLVL